MRRRQTRRWIRSVISAAMLAGASGCTFFPAPRFGPRDGSMDGSVAIDSGVALDSACAPGTLDCDRDPSNGCETRESNANCGRCERVCALPSATPSCVAGECVVAQCVAGFGNCDDDPANGCEERLDSAAHCGRCRNRCESGTPRCNGGECTSGCAGAQLRCGGLCVDAQTNDAHCGACGNACGAVANGQSSCVAGRCELRCTPGFANCDGNAANGCETPLGTSVNCSDCRAGCPSGSSCNAAMRTCQPGCALTDCGGACVDTNTSSAHCGMCGRSCPTLPNSTPSCAAGRCQSTCVAGYGDCDANPTNGCEVQHSSNALHCGTCGRACRFANATASCTSGVCTLGTCEVGFADCDRDPANGCEVDTRTSMGNCGGCGRVCDLPHASAACIASACQFASCDDLFGNCDGNPANGCEQSLTGNFHCGECSNVCGDISACSRSRCEVIAGVPACRCP